MKVSTLNPAARVKNQVQTTFSAILLALLFTLTSSLGMAQTASIATDQADYAPGSTVTITGAGFQANETVTLQVVHHLANGDNDTSAAHQPWAVLADANGNVNASWQVPFDQDEYGATLLLTANGVTSGLHAEAVFTDAGPTIVTVGGGAAGTCPFLPTATWTTPPSGVTFSNWSRGVGVTCGSAASCLSGSGFNAVSAAAGFSANAYYSVTITADATTSFTLSSISWITQLSGSTNSCNFTVQYKNNGGTLTTFGTAGQSISSSGSQTTLTFTGSVTIAAGTSIIIYMTPHQATASTTTVRWINGSTFSVTATPTTTSISPTSATVGSGLFTLTVNGTNFITGSSTVTWNGVAKPTTFVNSTQLTAVIPASDIVSAGTANVGVTTTGAAAASNTQTFTIIPQTPTITSLSPSSATAGAAGFTLTVNGTNFVSGSSTVTWGGVARTTTFVSSTQLTAVIPASDIVSAGTANVGVTTTGAAAASNTQTFTINASSASAGIYESYAIMNFGGSDVYYDLNAATSNTDFNGANLGTYNSSQSLYLDGAQIKTYKCSAPSDVLNGKLFYRIYLTSATPGAFSAGTNLPWISNDGASGCGGLNQSWQEAAAGINLLNGLCDGAYTVEVYTSADINTGTAFANNGGANYKASFTVNNSGRSGIFQSAVILKLNGGSNTYYDLLVNTPNFDFTGSLGTFCPNGSLVIAGAENKTFKCTPNDITGNSLKYRVYAGTGAGSGSFITVPIGFGSNDAGAGAGCQNQTWQSTSNTTDILAGLTPGTYTLEVYTDAAYTSNGICPGTNFANNGGANYKATFTVVLPTATATNSGPVCTGSTLNLFASSGASYAWSGPNGFTSTAQNPTVNPATIAAGGTYTVIVTDATGCTATASTTAVVNSFSNAVAVLNENFGTGTTLPSGWSTTGTATWTNSTGVASTGDYTGASGGSNALADNNSTADASLISSTINFSSTTNGILTFGIKRSSASFIRNIAVEASIDNGATYTAFTQTINASAIPSGSSYGLQTINLGTSINNSSQVKIRWRLLGSAGTGGPNVRIDDAVLTKDVPAVASITAGGPISFCTPGSVILTASPAASYLWSNGSTLQSITVTSAGNYNCNLTSANGCSAQSNTITVTTTAGPASFSMGGGGAYCTGGAGVDITLSGSEVGVSYQLFSGVNAVGSPVTGAGSSLSFGSQTAAGTYTVVATNGSCTATMTGSATVSLKTAPVITCPSNITVSNTTGLCAATVNYPVATATGTPAPVITYSIASGSSFPVGPTIVTATATNDCGTVSCSFTVTVNDTQAPTVICKNITVELDANGSAVITAAQIDNGSTDNCGAVTLAASKTSFDCSNVSTTQNPTDLIISEYVEGSSNNKYLELYNGTASTINLAGYKLNLYNNTGNSSSVSQTITLSGSLPAGNAIVYKNNLATAYSGTAIVAATVINFNGDDAIALLKTTEQYVDIFGVIGNDPGTAWTSAGGNTTTGKTLRRKSSVITGVTTNPSGTGAGAFTTLATEWDQFATDNVLGLGTHTASSTSTVPVILTVTDAHGNSATCTASVTVKDVTAPVVSTLADVTGECSATAVTATANDNCSGTVIGTTTDALTYNTQGTYTIHWSFKDASGNTSTATQTVVVDDVTAPATPTLSTVTGECSASVTAPIAVDNCVGNVTGTTTDPTSYTAQGTYTVNWSFNDGNGNTSTTTQTVLVDDVTAPVAPTLSTVTGECSASVTAPTAVDNCVGNVTGTTTDPTSYTAQGTYTVNWTFNDGNGNTSTTTQTVVVDDVTAPVAPTLSTVTGECSASVTAPTAVDNCVGNVTGTTTDPTSFTAQGTYTVNWSFNDSNGNTSTATQTVTVNDITPPTIDCPSNIVLSACTETATWTTPVANDNCSGVTVAQTAGPASGSTFANGSSTTITYTATDAGGNQTSCSFTVTRDAALTGSSIHTTLLCFSDSSSVVISAAGGTAPYTYTNPTGIMTIANPSGIYTNSDGAFKQAAGTNEYTVTDANGCSTTVSVNITQPTKILVTTASTNVSCNAGSNGSASITGVTGGTPTTGTAYSFSWTGPGGFTSTSQNLTGLVAGTYRYTVTDGNACGVSADIYITQPDAIVLHETHTIVGCLIGGISTVTITATGGTPDLTFSNPNGYKFTASGATQLPASLTSGIFQQIPLTPLTYTVTDVKGCTGTLLLDVIPGDYTAPTFTRPADITIAPSQGSSCYNASTTITGDVTNEGDAVWSGLQATYTDVVTECGFKTIIKRRWHLEDGCHNAAPDQIQTITVTDNNTPYLVFAKKEAKFGQYNLINGSVGVSATNGKVTFEKNSQLLAPEFVKAAAISVQTGATVTNKFLTAATDGPNPVFYKFAGNTERLGNYSVNSSTAVPVSGNYKKLTIKKNVTVTVSGTLYGKIDIETGAQVTFSPAGGIVNIESLKIKGKKTAVTKIKFTGCTSVRVKDKVDFSENVWVNQENQRVTFYLGDDSKDEEKFDVHGGNTRVTANIYIKDGKLKVSGGERDHSDGDHDIDGEERDQSECNSDTTYMTGWFIVEKLESDGKHVEWNRPICNSSSFGAGDEDYVGAPIKRTPVTGDHFEVLVLPNPSTTNFRLLVETYSMEPITVRVYEASGKLVTVKDKMPRFSIISVGDNYRGGTYYAEISQGDKRKVVKLVKLN
jgi:hypothetical protein